MHTVLFDEVQQQVLLVLVLDSKHRNQSTFLLQGELSDDESRRSAATAAWLMTVNSLRTSQALDETRFFGQQEVVVGCLLFARVLLVS